MVITGVQSSRGLGLLGAPLEGMRQARRMLEENAGEIARGNLSPESMVGLIEARASFKANAAAARTSDEVLGHLIDTFA